MSRVLVYNAIAAVVLPLIQDRRGGRTAIRVHRDRRRLGRGLSDRVRCATRDGAVPIEHVAVYVYAGADQRGSALASCASLAAGPLRSVA